MATVRHLPPLDSHTGPGQISDPPADIGTGHPMRQVTESVAADDSAWSAVLASEVREFFDGVAPQWGQEGASAMGPKPLRDALVRGLEALGLTLGRGPLAGPILELGAGTGVGAMAINDVIRDNPDLDAPAVIAGDISAEMLARLPPQLAARIQLDASTLPMPDHSIGTVVCLNMFLFAAEVRRVLRPGGVLVWVNSIGERTPIHLSAEQVAAAMGEDCTTVASRAGWGTWAIVAVA